MVQRSDLLKMVLKVHYIFSKLKLSLEATLFTYLMTTSGLGGFGTQLMEQLVQPLC